MLYQLQREAVIHRGDEEKRVFWWWFVPNGDGIMFHDYDDAVWADVMKDE